MELPPNTARAGDRWADMEKQVLRLLENELSEIWKL